MKTMNFVLVVSFALATPAFADTVMNTAKCDQELVKVLLVAKGEDDLLAVQNLAQDIADYDAQAKAVEASTGMAKEQAAQALHDTWQEIGMDFPAIQKLDAKEAPRLGRACSITLN